MPLWYHKTDSYRWLTGSIRQDLIPDERSVWADFMAMAALTREPRRGYIERSEGIPYDRPYLLSFLNISGELLDRTIAKCAKEGRLQVYPDGTMYLPNFGRYNDTVDRKSLAKEKKEAAIERAAETRHRRDVSADATLRAVNTLNTRLKQLRYTVIDDGSGRVLDNTTGAVSSIEDIRNDKG